MKRLYCLRHAKAVAKDPADDVDRVLAPRGRRQMKVLAGFIDETRIRPDRALVSPSARTRETWARTGLKGVPTIFEARIYEALPETLLDVVREADDAAQSLVMVGHNPGFEKLMRGLAGRVGEPHALARLAAKVPTAALAIFDLPVDRWAETRLGSGRLIGFVTPAWLGDEADD